MGRRKQRNRKSNKDAKKGPTLIDRSTSQQSVEVKVTIDLKKEDSQLKEQNTPDQLSAGSSARLSSVAAPVTANFTDRSIIIPAHSKPDSKMELGKFQFTIANVSDLGPKTIFSPYHTIANLPWKMCVKSNNTKEGYISIYLYCNPDSSSIFWSCETDIKFQLLCSDSTRKPYVKNMSYKFKYADSNYGFHKFLKWGKLIDPDNGYVNNNEVIIEVQITIKKIVGFREFSEFDFVSDAPDSKSDVVLIVGGQRLRACKHYLAIYSPVFHTMFFGDFIERDKKEIVLEDIEPDEFLELLHLIYPTHKPVTKDNVDFLLKLGDRFEVQFVLSECERFLLSTTEVSTPKKLLHAEKYRFANLQDVCLKTIKGLDDVKTLKKQEEYKEYSHETKAAILERLIV